MPGTSVPGALPAALFATIVVPAASNGHRQLTEGTQSHKYRLGVRLFRERFHYFALLCAIVLRIHVDPFARRDTGEPTSNPVEL
jgi:hypothetical protein